MSLKTMVVNVLWQLLLLLTHLLSVRPFILMLSILWQMLANTGKHRNKKNNFIWNSSTWFYSACSFLVFWNCDESCVPRFLSPWQLHGVYGVSLVYCSFDVLLIFNCLYFSSKYWHWMLSSSYHILERFYSIKFHQVY